MIRLCLILTSLAISAMSIGCCGPMGCGVDVSMSCNRCDVVDCVDPIYRPLDGVRQLRGRWACGSGCAETYYGEWRSTPPDAQDPCCDEGCGTSREFCWSGCWQPGSLLRGLYGERYCDDCGSESGCECGHSPAPEFMEGEFMEGEFMEGEVREGEVMPELAEPTVAMMTSGCDCPNCRAGKAVNLVEYSRAPQRGSARSAPSSRTVSYRNAAPSTPKMR